MNIKKLWPLGLVIALVVLGSLFPSLGGDESPSLDEDIAGQVTGSDDTPNSDDVSVSTDAAQFSNLPVVTVDELPIEALDTLSLIASGGPYPFDRDDLTFQNRERLLPIHEQGHYREYTVITPGENDRGARRIVAGADGERYYTADHYSSFSEIVDGP